MNFNVNTSIIANNGYINFEGFDQSNEDVKMHSYGLISRLFWSCLGTEFVSVTGTNNKVFYTTKAKMDAWENDQTAIIQNELVESNKINGNALIKMSINSILNYRKAETAIAAVQEEKTLVEQELQALYPEQYKKITAAKKNRNEREQAFEEKKAEVKKKIKKELNSFPFFLTSKSFKEAYAYGRFIQELGQMIGEHKEMDEYEDLSINRISVLQKDKDALDQIINNFEKYQKTMYIVNENESSEE